MRRTSRSSSGTVSSLPMSGPLKFLGDQPCLSRSRQGYAATPNAPSRPGLQLRKNRQLHRIPTARLEFSKPGRGPEPAPKTGSRVRHPHMGRLL